MSCYTSRREQACVVCAPQTHIVTGIVTLTHDISRPQLCRFCLGLGWCEKSDHGVSVFN